MAEITKLNITELDFDTIKTNLKDYFASQSEFTDHDFDGSAISVMMDVLAYNTHYNAYYMNMLASEAFLDSAQLRDSVVAKARMLGYTPRSSVGSKANVAVTITPNDSPATITIDKHTQFTSTINGTSYVFCTANSHTITVDDGNYIASGVTLSQGIPITFRYTANTANTEQKFLLPNANTDVETLTVTIQESSADTNTAVYTKATDITAVNATSNVYFLSEDTSGQFCVDFGDGVLGRKPITGNIVLLSALVTEGEDVNGANTFSAAGSVGGYSVSSVAVATSNSAIGGMSKETIDQIKFNAPKNFETQNRAVTTDDYKSIIERDVAGLDSVSVWGGQDHSTPQYGTVYISAKPTGASTLSLAQIAAIKEAVSSYNVLAIVPEIVDPDIIDLNLAITVKYDSRLTTLSSGAVAEKVVQTVNDYKTNNLLKFGSIFRYSLLSTNIDKTETSIINNLTTITAKKGIVPSTTTKDSYTVSFNNPIYNESVTYEGAVTSTAFSYTDASGNVHATCYFDDLNGTIRIYYLSGSDKVLVSNTAGTVTYSNGHIAITSFKPNSYVGSKINFTMKPSINDLIPIRNQMFEIANTNITVTMQDDAGTGTTVTSTSSTGTVSSTTTGTTSNTLSTIY